LPIITLISTNEAFAQSSLKYFHKEKKVLYFAAAVFFYALVAYCIFLAYDYKGVGMVNTLWSGMSILFMLIVGVLIFEERISAIEGFGVFLIIIGIVLINWYREDMAQK
jgi:multidrug transporter EmrE-like cation transporter